MTTTLEMITPSQMDVNIGIESQAPVDFPEDVKIAIEPNQLATAVLVGSRIKCALL